MVASLLMTIHKQKSKAKPRVLQCNLFFFPPIHSKEQNKEMASVQLSLPASLSASFSMCNSRGCTGSLSPQRTGHSCGLLSFPGAVAWRVAVLHTSPLGGGGRLEWLQHPVGPQGLSLHSTSQGDRLALVSGEPAGKLDPKPAGLCFRLHRLSLWGHLRM